MATGIPRAPKHGSSKALGSSVKLEYPGKVSEASVIGGSRSKLLHVGDLFISPKPEVDLFFGDNLGILRALCRQYRGKINLVYIDPPFASSGNYSTRTLDHAYEDDLHGFHYIEFLRKRLILLRELLADDGSIYVHLDANMAFTIKLIMDEVFGPQNFRNFIVRKKCNPKNFTRKSFGNISDYILFYTKTEDYLFNRQYEPWTDESAKREYQYVDENGRRYKKVPVHAPGIRNGATGQPWRGKYPPPGKHWQYPPEVLDAMDQRGEIYWSPTGNPRRKIYFDESKGIPIQDVWLDCKDPHNQNIKITGYPTEKNQGLLERIILASSRPGDIVLDAFAGSGTTMTAAMMHERNCILIDNSPVALNCILSRFLNGLSRMGDFVNDSNGVAEQQIETGKLKLFAEEGHYDQVWKAFEEINRREVA